MNFDFTLSAPKPKSLLEANKLIDSLWQHCKKSNDTSTSSPSQANSSNSSLPPSSDSIKIKAEKQKERLDWKKKTSKYWKEPKHGAQPGHIGRGRSLIPVDKVDKVISLYPDESCSHCQSKVKGRQLRRRKQIFDIKNGSGFVTEYQLYGGQCSKCNKRYCAKLPSDIPSGLFGDDVIAKISLLTGKYRLSKSEVKDLLNDFFKLQISTGSISNAEHKVSVALKPCVDELAIEVNKQEVIHADETSHFNKGNLCWLWVATNTMLTLFKINPNRNTNAAMLLLGKDFSGALIADRYAAYNFIPSDRRQYCWAHLKRDFVKLSEHQDSKVASLGFSLVTNLKAIFSNYRKIKNKTAKIYQPILLRRAIARFYSKLRSGRNLDDDKTRKPCIKLLKNRKSLWLFYHNANVEPTNNHAERQIRHAVIWRKKCFGTQSVRGMFYVERILSVIKTCQQQNLNCFDFIKKSLIAKREGSQTLSLIIAE